MPQEAIYVIAFAVGAFILLSPLHRGFVMLVAATFLTPPALIVPAGGVIPGLSVGRIALIASLLALAMRLRSGEVPMSALAVTPVHVAFFLFLIASLWLGVANAIPSERVGAAVAWWNILDQTLFFIVALAVARTTEEAWIVRVIAVIIILVAAVGAFEYATGRSWGHLLGRQLPEEVPARRLRSTIGGLVLRGGEIRARAGSEFALAFGWICAIMLPAVVAVIARARRAVLWVPLFGLVLFSITVSFSRTAVLGTPVVLAIILVASRFRPRITVLVAGAFLTAALVTQAFPSLVDPFYSSSAQGSSQGRAERLPVAMAPVADRPFTGLGFRGLEVVRVGGLDASYLLAYATFGAIGATVLMGLLAVSGGAVLRGVRVGGENSVYPAIALAGVAAGIGAASAFDMFAIQASPKAFWLMVGLGIAFAERRVGPQRLLWRPTFRRAMLPVAGVVAGLAILVATPPHTAVEFRFSTLAPGWEVRGGGLMTFPGVALARTTCLLLPAVQRLEPDAKIECREDFMRTIAGWGVVRVQARTPEKVQEATTTFRRFVEGYFPTFQPHFTDEMRTGRPSWARTAPVWLGISGLLAALFAPPVRLRLRRAGLRRRATAIRSRVRSAPT